MNINKATSLLLIMMFLFSCKTTKQKKAEIQEPVKIKDGTGKIQWGDGSLKGEGSFANFLKEGKWILYHKRTGEVLARGEYHNDKQTGIW